MNVGVVVCGRCVDSRHRPVTLDDSSMPALMTQCRGDTADTDSCQPLQLLSHHIIMLTKPAFDSVLEV